jgi:acetyl-CoA C-acetyltransferase/acetyl-CoA acyltransferase
MTIAYLVDGIRTPIGSYGGALSQVRPDDLAAHVLRELTSRLPQVDWSAVDDVYMGCANQSGEDNRNVTRMAILLSGLPTEVPGTTVNRLCGSGADAIAMAARAIISGQADLAIAGGVESMSRAPFVVSKSTRPFGRDVRMEDTTLGWRFVNKALESEFGVDTMGETAENVAEKYGVSREDQDSFALQSQQRAAKARSEGRLAREIVPVPVPQRRGDPVTVEHDEHPRETTLEKLAQLRPAFRPNGSVTAGNSSGINDGAAALLIASESAVERYGLTPLARVTGAAAAGIEPRIMGMGPVPATRRLMQRAGLTIDAFDVVELNEAFAAQALAVLRELGLPTDGDFVNPNGGAIALGHPLGMSGARLALNAAIELNDRGADKALVTMCIGVGQGISLLLERAR